MKRYDTHRNFPPARRPRDSTPAPPEDDELERLLTAPLPASSDASPAGAHVEPEATNEEELSAPAPSSVASALTAYVESLPASDPEPRLEESEIDVDAEAARRAASVALLRETALAFDRASSAHQKPADLRAEPGAAGTQPSAEAEPVSSRLKVGDDDAEDQDDGEEDDDDEPASVTPPSSRHSEPAPVDSIAAIARSTAPAAIPKRGVSPALWIFGFTLGGIGLALWSMRNSTELHGKSASEPPTAVVVSPARPEPIPTEPAAIPPPSPSGSVTPTAPRR